MTFLRRLDLYGRFLGGLQWISWYLAYARSLFRSHRQVIRVWPEGYVELDENVALFVHFDRRGRLGEHVLRYVRALHDNGFSVVFISNSGQQRPDSLAALQPLCRAVVVRHNVGYDFGAIRETLDLLGLPRQQTQRLLIANDSVYGPLVPIDAMLARVDFDVADLWGLTESWQRRYHLQSYFLLAGRRAMTSPAWQTFWRKVQFVSSKKWIVNTYEVGFTQALLRAGVRCRALWPYHRLLENCGDLSLRDTFYTSLDPLEERRMRADERILNAIAHLTPLNPTAELWRQLLLDGFPFIKVELLRDNPTGVPDVADWRSVVARLPGADVEMIEQDLQLKMRDRAP